MNLLYRVLVALGISTSLAEAAGLTFVEVPADGGLRPLRAAIWYPCDRQPTELKIGPFTLVVAKDCPGGVISCRS